MSEFKKNYKKMELSILPEELDDLIAFLNETQPYGDIDRLSALVENYQYIREFEVRNKDIAPEEQFMTGMICYVVTKFSKSKALKETDDGVVLTDLDCEVMKLPYPSKTDHQSIESFNAAFREAKSANYLVLRFDNRRALKIGFVCIKGDGNVFHTADFKVLSYIWKGLDEQGVPKNGIGPWSQPEFGWLLKEKVEISPPDDTIT